MIIDAYSHCGRTKYLPVSQVLSAMDKAGVSRTVLCQHLNDYDNSYLAEVVAQYPDRFAAVCLIDPSQPDAWDRLQEWNTGGFFRGVRLLAPWLAQNTNLYVSAMKVGLNLVVYAPDGIESSVPKILEVARSNSVGKIVISHLGTPKVIDGRLVEGRALFSLTEMPNVFVQLSGQSMVCEYPYSPLDEFTAQAIERFGPSRVMWGSNFPVCGDGRSIQRDLDLVRAGAWGLDQAGAEMVTSHAAMHVWFSPA
jgi:L-fuconolactonase